MKPLTAILVLAGLGALAWWWLRRQGDTSSNVTQQAGDGCGNGVLGTIGSFVKSHVARKDAIAPYVAQGYAKIPAAQAAPLTSIAGKLSPSGYVEKYLGDKVGTAICDLKVPSLSAIVGTVTSKVGTTTRAAGTFGEEQLKAGTIAPATDLYHAGQDIARGDVSGAAGSVVHSATGGVTTAYHSTVGFVKSLF
jgi:hypothetical protein